MNILKKLLLLITILLTVYVLFRLFKTRKDILESSQKPAFSISESMQPYKVVEGYTSKSAAADPRNLFLYNYCIKSSYNSCLNNQTLSTDTLKSVLKRGYRLIDLEVAMVNSSVSVCANSTYTDDTNQSSSNTILLSDVLDAVKKYGLSYTSDGAPNYLEPLFINLRIKMNGITDQTAQVNLLNSVSTVITSSLSNYLYPVINTNGKRINVPTLSLSNVMKGNRKCFFIIDITDIGYTYQSSNLNNIVHLAGGFNVTGQVKYYAYDDANATSNNYSSLSSSPGGGIASQNPATVNKYNNLTNISNTTNSGMFNMAIPQNSYESPNYYPLNVAKNYTIQMGAMNAALSDTNLKTYEAIFNTSSASSTVTGFISMAQVVKLANSTTATNSLATDVKRAVLLGVFMLAVVSGIIIVTKQSGITGA